MYVSNTFECASKHLIHLFCVFHNFKKTKKITNLLHEYKMLMVTGRVLIQTTTHARSHWNGWQNWIREQKKRCKKKPESKPNLISKNPFLLTGGRSFLSSFLLWLNRIIRINQNFGYTELCLSDIGGCFGKGMNCFMSWTSFLLSTKNSSLVFHIV